MEFDWPLVGGTPGVLPLINLCVGSPRPPVEGAVRSSSRIVYRDIFFLRGTEARRIQGF